MGQHQFFCVIHNVAPDAPRLNLHRVDQIAEGEAQTIKLVEKIQHHIDAFIVDTHFVGEIGYQRGPCNVDLPKYWPSVQDKR